MKTADVADIRDHLAGKVERPRKKIEARPFVLRDASQIPTREWLYGKHYIRGFLGTTLAPGGVGKSTQALVEAVAMASARDLLGVAPRHPLRVWYWNGEDPYEELERRVSAICLHFKITADDLGGRLFVNSFEDCEIVVAEETRDGAEIAVPVIEELEATLTANAIDVFMLDPFVACHEVSENDNSKINRVVKELSRLAKRTSAAGELVHHVRKSSSGEGGQHSVEDGRGASALLAAVRSARVLNVMDTAAAVEQGVNPEERFSYFRVDHGKANLSRRSGVGVWRRVVSVDLCNGRDLTPSDHVGVCIPWEPTSAFDKITSADVLRVQLEIDEGKHRESAQAGAWVGKAIAKALDWNADDPTIKAQLKSVIRTWLRTGVLEIYEAQDANREMRPHVRVGKWVSP